jgi:hypothetical protein
MAARTFFRFSAASVSGSWSAVLTDDGDANVTYDASLANHPKYVVICRLILNDARWSPRVWNGNRGEHPMLAD